MPGNVSVNDGLLHALALLGRGALEILVEKPRACGPNVALAARLAQLCGEVHRTRKEFGEVFLNDGSLGVSETGVEMTLEHDQHVLDAGIRRRRRKRRLKCQERGRFEQQSAAREGLDEFATPHMASQYDLFSNSSEAIPSFPDQRREGIFFQGHRCRA